MTYQYPDRDGEEFVRVRIGSERLWGIISKSHEDGSADIVLKNEPINEAFQHGQEVRCRMGDLGLWQPEA